MKDKIIESKELPVIDKIRDLTDHLEDVLETEQERNLRFIIYVWLKN